MKLIKGGKKESVVEKDHSNHWRVVVPNPDHPHEEGACSVHPRSCVNRTQRIF
jgi:hypothetical protein